MWESSSNCKDSVSDLTAIKNQIHAYVNNPAFQVYVYKENPRRPPPLGGG
jgi:hypothetical protein